MTFLKFESEYNICYANVNNLEWLVSDDFQVTFLINYYTLTDKCVVKLKIDSNILLFMYSYPVRWIGYLTLNY